MPIKISPTLVTLFISCGLVQILYPTEVIEVLPFILCAISAGLIYYLDQPLFKRLALLTYIALSIYEPEYIIFIPVVLYAYVEEDSWHWTALAILPYVLQLDQLVQAPSKVFISLLLGIMAILLKQNHNSHTQLKRDLIEKADAMRELDLHLNEKNRALMAHQDDEIHYATLKERNRIAREIHDHVGHQLSRVLLQIGAQLTLKPSDPALLSMKDTLDSAMDNLRNSVHDLHDTSIELETQLRQITAQFEKCPVTLTLHLDTVPDTDIKIALVAILKESLSNVSKHSNATEVKISLIEHPSFFQFIIVDNGSAPHAYTQDDPHRRGIGLKNIEQRVAELKGRFLIRTQNGFELFITLPKS